MTDSTANDRVVDWNTTQGNEANSASMIGSASLDLPSIRLVHQVASGWILSAPIISHRRIVVNVARTTGVAVVAVDLMNGTTAWELPLSSYPPCYWSSGVITDDRLIHFDQGMMRTVDMESGRIVAEVDMGDDWVAVSPPRLVDGILVIGNAYGELCAISLAGNQVHWRLEGDSSLVYSPPAVVKGALVFSACGPHGSTVTSAVDGKVRWQWKVSATIRGICSTDGELVFVKTLSDSISFVALDAVTGEIRWDREMEPAGIGEAAYSDQSGVAVASGLVVNAFTPGRVEARRTEDGELIWAQSTTGECFCSPVADVRHIVVACVDGSVYVLELGTGEICRILKAKAPLKSTPALTNDGAIVVGQSGGIWIIAKEFQEKEGG